MASSEWSELGLLGWQSWFARSAVVRTCVKHYRPWQLVVALGWVLGFYGWEFWTYNLDFTGPHAMGWASAPLFILLAGPVFLLACWVLCSLAAYLTITLYQTNRVDSSQGDGPFLRDILARDAWTYLPLSIFILSPLFYLLLGQHSTEYQAAVVVLVSLSVSGVVALKAWALHDILGGAFSVSDRFCRRLVWAMVGLYTVICGTLVVLRYNAYNVWGVDLGLVDEALWNTLHGRFMQITLFEGAQTNLFATHFEPVFLLLLPLYAVWSEPRLLLIVQVVIVGLGAIPLYGLTRRRLRSDFAAACFALGYLVFPSTVSAGLAESASLRSDALAMPILLLTLYYLERRRRSRFLATAFLALACKEYVALVVALLGLYILFRKRDVRLGLVTLGMSVAWFAVVMWGFIPYSRRGEESLYYQLHFSHLGGEAGLVGILASVINDPVQVLHLVFTPPKMLFFFFLLFSAGLLPLLDTPTLLVSAPIFGIFFLRKTDHPISQGDFHFLVVLPFLFPASIEGVKILRRKIVHLLGKASHNGRSFSQARLTTSISAYFLASCALAGFFWGSSPLSWAFWSPGRPYQYWRNLYIGGERAQRVDDLLDLIPDDVPVFASDYLVAQLNRRETVYHFFWPPSDALERVDYAVADLLQNHVRTEEQAAREMELLDELLSGPDFALRVYEDGLLFFQRDATDGYVSRVEVLAEDPQPQVRLERDLGRRLRLLGYDPPAGSLRAGERCRLTYYWQVLDGLAAPFDIKLSINPDESIETHWRDYVLADRFAGAANEFSVLHLPTYVQMPPEDWQPGQVIRETYDLRLPADARGEYDWSVGLYAVPKYLGIRINSERQVPGAEPVLLGTLSVDP